MSATAATRGQVVLARRDPTGKIAFGSYLLDVFCLGVKDSFWSIVPEGEYDDILDRAEEHGELQNVTPEYLAKLVFGVVEFARQVGIAPHADFRHACRLLDGIDPMRCDEQFEFEFALDILLDGFERLRQQGWTSAR